MIYFSIITIYCTLYHHILFYIIIVLMASKQSLKLFDVAFRLQGVYLRTVDWFWYGLFRVRKEIAIIGSRDDSVVQSLKNKVAGCNVTIIEDEGNKK